MLDWLQSYWGAVVAIVAILGSLWGLAEKLEKKLEQHQPLREWVADGLIMPSWHDAYRDWLGHQLDRLHSWMGGPWSPKALARCLAIAFGYPVVLMLVGYGVGGPGTIGTTEFLPAFPGWRQPALGFVLILVMGGLGLIWAFHERIDDRLRASLEARLKRRGVANATRRADRLYRFGGAVAAASLWLASAFYAVFP